MIFMKLLEIAKLRLEIVKLRLMLLAVIIAEKMGWLNIVDKEIIDSYVSFNSQLVRVFNNRLVGVLKLVGFLKSFRIYLFLSRKSNTRKSNIKILINLLVLIGVIIGVYCGYYGRVSFLIAGVTLFWVVMFMQSIEESGNSLVKKQQLLMKQISENKKEV